MFIHFPSYLQNVQFRLDHRGGYRIPRRRGRQPSGGAPTYDFAKFSEKLHEIEKILGRRGGAPLGSATGLGCDLSLIREKESIKYKFFFR